MRGRLCIWSSARGERRHSPKEDKTAALSSEEKALIVADLKKKLEDESLASLLSTLKKAVGADSRASFVEEQFSGFIQRLTGEINALTRRGNLNLVLGIMTTASGLFLLGYFVLHQPALDSKTLMPYLLETLPRLTLVVFIEVFAYFFLTLYKSSLSEIKYYQNEITNLESKMVATRVALVFLDSSAQVEVIRGLLATERNRFLEKDESTWIWRRLRSIRLLQRVSRIRLVKPLDC